MTAWTIDRLPFHVGVQTEPTNPGLPDELPFTLVADEARGLLVQAPAGETASALERAYAAGSQPGTPMSPQGAGRAYLDDFLDWLERVDGRSLDGLRVLEVGPGSGALLVELARRGARCVGIDPSPAPVGLPDGVEYRSEPFDRDAFDERFDLIVHFTVLEHLAAPDEVLRDQLGLLAPGGRVACAVPDCGPAVAHGDLSMLFHEHINYFTEESLRALSARLPATLETVERSAWGGLLYASWAEGAPASGAAAPDAKAILAAYRERAEAAAQAIGTFLEAGGCGVYVPGRIVNYLALLDADTSGIRFFDDDPALTGRYYPPFPIPVEARDGLAERPPARILVASWSFGSAIRDRLAGDPALAAIEVASFEDLL